MTTETATDSARKQAIAQYDSIVEMLDRMSHAQECSADMGECELSPAEITGGLGYGVSDEYTLEQFEDYHDEDAATEVVDQNALSAEVRSDWEMPGAELTPGEYKILLCTGGPAVQIIGDLNEHGDPVTAELQHQDWFTPWEHSYTDAGDDRGPIDEAILLNYAGRMIVA